MSEKLLPCPFCDGEAIKTTDMGREAVACANCDISIRSIQVTGGYDWCVEQWNTRPTQQPPAGEYYRKEDIEKALQPFWENQPKIIMLAIREALVQLPTTTIPEGEALNQENINALIEFARAVRKQDAFEYPADMQRDWTWLDRIEAQIKGYTK